LDTFLFCEPSLRNFASSLAPHLPEKNKFAPVRFFLLLTISMISLSFFGQSRSELAFSSPDSVAFFLAIDGVAVPDSAQYEFEIATHAGEVLVDILLADSTARDLSTSITIEDGFRTAYEITQFGSNLTLLKVSREILDGQIDLSVDEASLINDSSIFEHDSSAFRMNPSVIETSRSLSTIQIVATNLSKYNELCINLYNSHFEKEKTKQALEFVDNNEHTVSNLVHILELLGYEDNRLIVAKRAYPKLMDGKNFLIALDYFQLERSKKELKIFFNEKTK